MTKNLQFFIERRYQTIISILGALLILTIVTAQIVTVAKLQENLEGGKDRGQRISILVNQIKDLSEANKNISLENSQLTKCVVLLKFNLSPSQQNSKQAVSMSLDKCADKIIGNSTSKTEIQLNPSKTP